jgi:hypothetical protein
VKACLLVQSGKFILENLSVGVVMYIQVTFAKVANAKMSCQKVAVTI